LQQQLLRFKERRRLQPITCGPKKLEMLATQSCSDL
jgi:hypothetical protein